VFKEKTTFVIGAGSGVDIDMPTGAKLIEEICRKLNFLYEGGRRKSGSGSDLIHQALQRASARHKIEMQRLLSAATAITHGAHHMGSIDSFIHAHSNNDYIKVCGKIAIVEIILDYEKRCSVFIDQTRMPHKFNDENKMRASWYDKFMSLLVGRIVANENLDNIFDNVAIINFNYDRCIEQYLHLSLQRSYLISPDRAAELISKLKIHHPYGVISKLPWQNQNRVGVHLGGDPHGNENDLEGLSQNIKTFNEEVNESTELDEIKSFMAESKRSIFLGFHFHDQNVALITPRAPEVKNVHHAFVSTYGRKAPELEIIKSQIETMFQATAHQTAVHLDVPECRPLLESYGTMLVS
jgi:hypothetical protein